MFREMRRKNQAISRDECMEILKKGSSGVLALCGDDGYPYAVPISYLYDENCLYFHCAKSGHKLDAIRKDSRASFCVVCQDVVVPEEFTTYFKSVIVFGKMEILEDEEEKKQAIERLAVKYAPDSGERERDMEIGRWWDLLCVLKMKIEHMTGKAAPALTKK